MLDPDRSHPSRHTSKSCGYSLQNAAGTQPLLTAPTPAPRPLISHLAESLSWLHCFWPCLPPICAQHRSQGNPGKLDCAATPLKTPNAFPSHSQPKPKFLPFPRDVQHKNKQEKPKQQQQTTKNLPGMHGQDY